MTTEEKDVADIDIDQKIPVMTIQDKSCTQCIHQRNCGLYHPLNKFLRIHQNIYQILDEQKFARYVRSLANICNLYEVRVVIDESVQLGPSE